MSPFSDGTLWRISILSLSEYLPVKLRPYVPRTHLLRGPWPVRHSQMSEPDPSFLSHIHTYRVPTSSFRDVLHYLLDLKTSLLPQKFLFLPFLSPGPVRISTFVVYVSDLQRSLVPTRLSSVLPRRHYSDVSTVFSRNSLWIKGLVIPSSRLKFVPSTTGQTTTVPRT